MKVLRVRAAIVGLGFLLVATLGVSSAVLAYASDQEQQPGSAPSIVSESEPELETPLDESRRILKEVMAGEAFHLKSTLRVPKFLEDFFTPKEEIDPETLDLPWLSKFLGVLATIVEILLWLGLAAFIAWLVYRLRRWDFSGIKVQPGDPERPALLMGLDVRAGTDPENILAAARSAWQIGQARQAISLLYRSALIRLMDDHHCQFNEGDTEGQCLGEARARADAEAADYFEQLTRHWQSLAYAHHSLDTAQFHTLLGGWERAWEDHAS